MSRKGWGSACGQEVPRLRDWSRFAHPIASLGMTVAGEFRGRLRGLAGFGRSGCTVLRSRPGVAHAVDYGDGREDCDHPQDGAHAVEECAKDDQHQPLRALHEAYAAGTDQRLGAGAGVADHDGADHHEGGQHYVEEAVAASVENEQSEKLGSVTVAVDYRIKESSEARDAVGGAGNLAVHKIEEAGEDDHQAAVEKHAPLIRSRGSAE